MRYQHIKTLRLEFPVKKMCQVLKIKRSSYYAWLKRGISKRSKENIKILGEIMEIRKDKRKLSYGAPTLKVELNENGIECSRNRVARIMQNNNITAKTKKKWKATTNSKHKLPIAENILNRNFSSTKPNEVWTSDITYIWTDEGWLYLAVILDIFSRQIIGWAMDKRMTKELVLDAIKQACKRRNPAKGGIFHSDRGVQYASYAVRDYIKEIGFTQSMSRKGNCWDNAITESFFHTLKTELIFWRKYRTRTIAKKELFEYIEVFYNRERRHSTLGYVAPAKFEEIWLTSVA